MAPASLSAAKNPTAASPGGQPPPRRPAASDDRFAGTAGGHRARRQVGAQRWLAEGVIAAFASRQDARFHQIVRGRPAPKGLFGEDAGAALEPGQGGGFRRLAFLLGEQAADGGGEGFAA